MVITYADISASILGNAKRLALSIFFACVAFVQVFSQTPEGQRPEASDDFVFFLDSIEKAYEEIMLDSLIQAYEEVLHERQALQIHRPLELYSRWRLQGQWGNDAAASLLLRDDYGTACDNSSNGFWRSTLTRDIHADDGRDWGVGGVGDWMLGIRYSTRRQLNQLAVDVRWKMAVATLGMKQQEDELSQDRLPLMQLRLATHGWQELPYSQGLLHVKGFAAYGLTTGQSWNVIYQGSAHEGFHSKQSASGAIALRIGKAATHFDNDLTMGFSARDDWRMSWRWRTSLAGIFGRVGAKVYNEIVGGEQTPLWSPRYRLGSDRQGFVLSYALKGRTAEDTKGYATLNVAQHRFQSWFTTMEYMCPSVLTVSLSHMYAPERFSLSESRYCDSDIRHALLLKAEYHLPLRFLPGISVSAAFGTDFCRKTSYPQPYATAIDPVNRRTVQVLLSWRRDIGASIMNLRIKR